MIDYDLTSPYRFKISFSCSSFFPFILSSCSSNYNSWSFFLYAYISYS